MNRDQRTTMFKNWFADWGDPAIWITISPRVPYAASIQMNRFFDQIHGGLLRKAFGSRWMKWKNRQVIRTVLVPEQDSKRTVRNTPQLLHYHGVIWTDYKNLKSMIAGPSSGFRDRLQHTLNRNLPDRNRGDVEVHAAPFKKDGRCIDYAMKRINRSQFTEGDIYFYN